MSIDSTELATRAELADMELWTAWVSKLMEHASTQAKDEAVRLVLAGAAEDATALRDAITAATTGWLDPGQTIIIRSIYELWDANHDRLERLAAAQDPEWHRMWAGRSAGARKRREAVRAQAPDRALIYCD